MSVLRPERNASGSEPAPLRGRRGGGPRLDRDEWTILFDIHMRHRDGATKDRAHDIEHAVGILSQIASRRGQARSGAQLRSIAGLSRRMTELRALDRGNAVNTPREAREIWLRYRADPEGCSRAAAVIMRREEGLDAPTSHGEGQPRSHGPLPSFGSYSLVRSDSETQVYLMELMADARWASVAHTDRGPIFKLGRTNDTGRRRLELNQGFPPNLGLEWQLIQAFECPDARTAHSLEQNILDQCEAAGHCLGREFLSIDRATIQRMLAQNAEHMMGKSGCADSLD